MQQLARMRPAATRPAIALLALTLFSPGCAPTDLTDEQGTGPGGKADSLLPDEDATSYFSASYDEARLRFRATAEQLAAVFPRAEIGAIAVPSTTDNDLTIDYLYLPAIESEDRLIILSGGVHGAEGFVGSAVQEMMLREWLPVADLSQTGVLFLHGVNPWGYRHRRRVTENNVDLNRNFDIDPSLFDSVNEGYRSLDSFLNEKAPVSWFDVNTSVMDLLWKAMVYGQSALREATLVGQYEFPEGIYYGGRAFEPNTELLEALLLRVLEPYGAVFVGDLHTGYGERGRLHLFGTPGLGSPEMTRAVFEGFPIDTGENNEDFYETKGDFTVYVEKLLPEGEIYVGTTLEYGTLDSQTTLGSIRSLQRMRLENQGYHHGFESDGVAEGVRERFNEMFYPSDPEWRKTIIDRTREMLPRFCDRFASLELPR